MVQEHEEKRYGGYLKSASKSVTCILTAISIYLEDLDPYCQAIPVGRVGHILQRINI